jgi:hypothetical protein
LNVEGGRLEDWKNGRLIPSKLPFFQPVTFNLQLVTEKEEVKR